MKIWWIFLDILKNAIYMTKILFKRAIFKPFLCLKIGIVEVEKAPNWVQILLNRSQSIDAIKMLTRCCVKIKLMTKKQFLLQIQGNKIKWKRPFLNNFNDKWHYERKSVQKYHIICKIFANAKYSINILSYSKYCFSNWGPKNGQKLIILAKMALFCIIDHLWLFKPYFHLIMWLDLLFLVKGQRNKY